MRNKRCDFFLPLDHTGALNCFRCRKQETWKEEGQVSEGRRSETPQWVKVHADWAGVLFFLKWSFCCCFFSCGHLLDFQTHIHPVRESLTWFYLVAFGFCFSDAVSHADSGHRALPLLSTTLRDSRQVHTLVANVTLCNHDFCVAHWHLLITSLLNTPKRLSRNPKNPFF